MRRALVYAHLALCAVLAGELSAQEGLARYGRESDVLLPVDVAAADAVDEIIDHRRLVESPGPDDFFSVVEMHFARLGIQGRDSACLSPIDSIIPVDPTAWPTNTETRFRIVSDASAEVYLVEEHEFACGGGGSTTYRHYFLDGRTVLFERYSALATTCSGRPASEVSTYYYSATQDLIAKEYSLTDPAGRAHSPYACAAFGTRRPYVIAASYEALISSRMRGMTVVPG